MKIATQNQAFFPTPILEKFKYIKAMGFDGYEIDGKLLVENLDEVKAAINATGLPVTTACGGYDGWIGDFIEERRLNGLTQIERILEALSEVGGKGIIVPAAWGMFTFRLPPMTSPRSLEGDRNAVSASLRWLDEVAGRTGTLSGSHDQYPGGRASLYRRERAETRTDHRRFLPYEYRRRFTDGGAASQPRSAWSRPYCR